MANLRDNYPTVRKSAYEWEYENYGDFKAALAAETESSSVDSLRNLSLNTQINVKEMPYGQNFSENMIKRVLDKFSGTITPNNRIERRDISIALKSLGELILILQNGGYLTKAEFETLKKHEAALGASTGGYFVHTVPFLHQLLSEACGRYVETSGNLHAIFDEVLANTRLPKGVSHVPDRVKKNMAQLHEGLINVTISPTTKSYARFSISAPPSTAVGPKYATSKLSLGNLVQGLPQKLWFGVLRNFWYSTRIETDIKRYLAKRYLRDFRQKNIAHAIADNDGAIIRFTEPQILGFAGAGGRGASPSRLQSAGLAGAGARNIATRTWIQHKIFRQRCQ